MSDGPDPAAARIAAAHGARHLALPEPRGANAARNAAVAATDSELVVFVDDDVLAPPGWLEAMLAGARATPDREVFGGPIQARLEGAARGPAGGSRPRSRRSSSARTIATSSSCGARTWPCGAPRSSGSARSTRRSSCAATRRTGSAATRAAGGRTRYLAAAGLEHRRTAEDSTLARLTRAAYGQGRAARRYDVRKGTAPPLRAELRVLVGCAWHTGRRRCAIGIVMGAHSAGRLREATSRR